MSRATKSKSDSSTTDSMIAVELRSVHTKNVYAMGSMVHVLPLILEVCTQLY